jgi:hypothetical protein
LADRAEGYSGADLQALLYNAHLEVVHESIASLPPSDKPSTRDDETPIDFVVLGGKKNGKDNVMSKADQVSLQRRVGHDFLYQYITPYLRPIFLLFSYGGSSIIIKFPVEEEPFPTLPQ